MTQNGEMAVGYRNGGECKGGVELTHPLYHDITEYSKCIASYV